jgi:hypothetical protein
MKKSMSYVKDELFTGIKLTNLGKYLKNITIENTAGKWRLLVLKLMKESEKNSYSDQSLISDIRLEQGLILRMCLLLHYILQ